MLLEIGICDLTNHLTYFVSFLLWQQGKPGQAVRQRSQATTAMQTDIYQELRHRAYLR